MNYVLFIYNYIYIYIYIYFDLFYISWPHKPTVDHLNMNKI